MRTLLQLSILGQCAVFTLSPLIVPSLLCSGVLLLSLFDASMLTIFSIPTVFSMVLGCIPAAFMGFSGAFIRRVLRFNHQHWNRYAWLVSVVILSAFVHAKFMSGISLHVVNLAYGMGALSALIACGIILLLEHYRENIFISRFYYNH